MTNQVFSVLPLDAFDKGAGIDIVSPQLRGSPLASSMSSSTAGSEWGFDGDLLPDLWQTTSSSSITSASSATTMTLPAQYQTQVSSYAPSTGWTSYESSLLPNNLYHEMDDVFVHKMKSFEQQQLQVQQQHRLQHQLHLQQSQQNQQQLQQSQQLQQNQQNQQQLQQNQQQLQQNQQQLQQQQNQLQLSPQLQPQQPAYTDEDLFSFEHHHTHTPPAPAFKNRTRKAEKPVPVAAPAVASAGPVNTQLYKTERCASYVKMGVCPYGNKCQFAHGENELKSVSRPPKWRSKPCVNWGKFGNCRYGNRCCFKHGD